VGCGAPLKMTGETKSGAQRARSYGLGASGLQGPGSAPLLYSALLHYRYPPDVAFYIFFSTTISTKYFKHAAQSTFFSSKCRLFYNATFSGSCIIHILHIGCAKI
jgi:hypothetical protein